MKPIVCAGTPAGGVDLPTLRWLAEQMPGGFFIYRAEEPLNVIYANDAVFRIFGCENQEEFDALTGGTFQGMVHPEDFPAIQTSIEEQIAESGSGSLDHVEYRIVRKDGSVRWVDDYGHLACFPDIGSVYYVFIGDITEYRLAREEKARVEQELEREKERSSIKSEFLFNVSHDIRTPMNAIIGFTDLARRHEGEPERLREDLQKVEDSSRQMMILIDDLLEMGSLEAGKLALRTETCNLLEQVRLSLNLFRPSAEKKGLAVAEELDLPAEAVLLDAGRFQRVMNNLLSNAVKFTPSGGSVTVSAKRTEVSESGYGRYVFTVADTGIGMSEEFMRRLYTAFGREESSTRAGTAGAGLGLSIARRLVDMMGGTISVESKKGTGSVFTVSLPLKLAERTAAPRPEAGEEARAKGERRVLVVEDIEINRMLAETILEEAGFLVESVPDGCDAVEAVAGHEPGYYDLVLMDIQMPVMNGYEATRAIRALDREDVKSLPILALSANAREEDRRMSLESGMNSHIAKPFDVANLIAAINEPIPDA